MMNMWKIVEIAGKEASTPTKNSERICIMFDRSGPTRMIGQHGDLDFLGWGHLRSAQALKV